MRQTLWQEKKAWGFAMATMFKCINPCPFPARPQGWDEPKWDLFKRCLILNATQVSPAELGSVDHATMAGGLAHLLTDLNHTINGTGEESRFEKFTDMAFIFLPLAMRLHQLHHGDDCLRD